MRTTLKAQAIRLIAVFFAYHRLTTTVKAQIRANIPDCIR